MKERNKTRGEQNRRGDEEKGIKIAYTNYIEGKKKVTKGKLKNWDFRDTIRDGDMQRKRERGSEG